MGLFGKFRQGINKLFQDEENPEIILEQTLWDMEKKLIQMRRSVAQAVASSKRVDRQRQQAMIAVQRWQNRAQMALTYGDELLSKEAIARSHSYKKVADNLNQQGQEQQTFIEGIRENLRDLETKINQIKMQKDMYIARIRSAVAQQQLHKLKAEIQEGTLEPAIANIEASMWSLEAENQLSDSLEAKFLALEKRARLTE
ncbi:phage shock protein A, PspA [[Leptolyngbya] sp. PCC 7376]|uniref:PspA/IM30 family protein n=1 Tax=[Leptolyngbya] sp. PCC 7376 TaxID=111781 RepID=UPI00029F2CDB|nr:PspA/IM30 family protein [[Leptolyngbya] sp. PCC 7376]AFY39191.1 phage shock protein A, PspA [[Leptolyngbya] sp. PCC 7376]